MNTAPMATLNTRRARSMAWTVITVTIARLQFLGGKVGRPLDHHTMVAETTRTGCRAVRRSALDLVDQAPRQRRAGVDRRETDGQQHGGVASDPPGQADRSSGARNETESHLGEGDAGVAPGHHPMGERSQLDTRAHRPPVDVDRGPVGYLG